MKAIFYLPAHPSYFHDEYTQEEINEAIKLYEQQTNGFISKGNDRPKVRQEVLLLHEPGKRVCLAFDSSGYGDGKEVSTVIKDTG